MGRTMIPEPPFERLRAEQDSAARASGLSGAREVATRHAEGRLVTSVSRRAAAWVVAATLGVAASAIVWQRWPGGVETLSFTIGDRRRARRCGAAVARPRIASCLSTSPMAPASPWPRARACEWRA